MYADQHDCDIEKKAKTVKSRPYAETRLAKFIETRVLELRPRKSQIEIATEAGYVKRNRQPTAPMR